MQAYSRSQGKIIDIPDQPTGDTSMGTIGGQVDPNLLKTVFTAAMMQQPKQATNLKSVYDFMAPKPEDATTKKRKAALNQLAPVLERITTEAQQAPGGMEGSLKAMAGKIPGVEGGQAEMLSRDVQGFARLIAGALASEVGVATDKDIQRWTGLMPQPGDTPKERANRMMQLIDQINTESASYGMKPKLPKITPESFGTNQPNSGTGPIEGILKLLYPQMTQLGNTIKEGTTKQLQTGDYKTMPQQDILASGFGPLGTAVAGTPEAKQAQGAGAEIALSILLPEILGKLTGTVKGATVGGASAKRAAQIAQSAESGQSFAGTPIQQAGDKFVEQFPQAAKMWENEMKAVRTMGPQELVDKINYWNTAFKESGSVGKTLKARLFKTLGDAGREVLSTEAPGIAQAQTGIHNAYQLQNLLSRLIAPAIGAAAAGVGGYAVGKATGK